MDDAASPRPGTAELETRVSSLRGRFPTYPLTFLGVIIAVGAIDFADRAVLAVVFEDIKTQFGVSDTALGSLVAAYTVVATLSVIPCGILADRWKRVWLIALGFLPWSLAMFWQGAATSFAMLFVARMFLGSIEATNGPSSLSLVGDWYPVERRSRVMGIWRSFEIIGSALGAGIAGVIATALGWRAPFFVFGGLGLVSAAVVLRVLREPERGLPDALHQAEQQLARARGETTDFAGSDTRSGAVGSPSTATPDTAPDAIDYHRAPLRVALRRIVGTRTAWVMVVAASVGLFASTGLGAWVTTFFRRFHDMSAAGAGGVTVIFGAAALAGLLVGARAGDRLTAVGRGRDRVKLAAVCYAAAWFMSVPGFALDNTVVAVAFLVAAGFLVSVPIAPLWAMWLDILVPQLRGRADALFSIIRVLAISTAPLVIGAISDATDLRVAFLAAMPVVLLNALIILLALNSYPRDVARARADALAQVGPEG
ncbi:MAG: MFS transporter [Acidimicrobiia bacterium]